MPSSQLILESIATLKRSTFPRQHEKAAETLGLYKDPEAVPHLLEYLNSKEIFANAKEAAAMALVQIGTPEAIRGVLQSEFKRDTDKAVRYVAVKFAGIREIMASQNINKRLNLDEIQPQLPEGVEDILAAYLEKTPSDIHTATARSLVAFALGGGRKTDTVVHALRNMLLDETDVAADVLGFNLPMLLDWRNWYYAGSFAGLSLIRLGDHDSAARIIELAMSKWISSLDEGPNQTALFRYMFDHGWKEMVPILAEIAINQSESFSKRHKALNQLAALDDEKVPSIIAHCWNDSEAGIRLHVIKKLEQIGDTPLVIQTLTQMTGDKKMAVRNAAKKALKKLKR